MFIVRNFFYLLFFNIVFLFSETIIDYNDSVKKESVESNLEYRSDSSSHEGDSIHDQIEEEEDDDEINKDIGSDDEKSVIEYFDIIGDSKGEISIYDYDDYDDYDEEEEDDDDDDKIKK